MRMRKTCLNKCQCYPKVIKFGQFGTRNPKVMSALNRFPRPRSKNAIVRALFTPILQPNFQTCSLSRFLQGCTSQLKAHRKDSKFLRGAYLAAYQIAYEFLTRNANQILNENANNSAFVTLSLNGWYNLRKSIDL